jgi:20S proteasome alpha/beta subunit
LLNGTEHIESYSKQIWELAQAAYPGFNSGYMSYWIMTSTTNSTTLTITSTSPSGTTIFNQTLIIGTSGRVVYPVLRSNVTIITETSEPAVITEQQNLYY